MKKPLGIVLGVILGVLIGVFGVWVSIFADGGGAERYITVAVILAIYAVLGAVFGYLNPGLSWKWGLILGGPGVLILLLNCLDGDRKLVFYSIYAVLVVIAACGGACLAASAKAKKTTQG